MAFIVGSKIGMTRTFGDDGTVTPVTVIHTVNMAVSQLKTKEKDGYEAVQFGFKVTKKEKKIELRIDASKDEPSNLKIGDTVTLDSFKPGDIVKVSGLAKGRGFQGAVKRHGFHGMPASHGHHHVLRHVGSIGQRFPQHTLKGMRMAGHMGTGRISVRGLKVISVDAASNTLAVKGAVPGRKGTLLEITKI